VHQAKAMALTGVGTFFSQGERQERAYRESLSEACGVLKALVIKVWAERFREKAKGLLRAYKKH